MLFCNCVRQSQPWWIAYSAFQNVLCRKSEWQWEKYLCVSQLPFVPSVVKCNCSSLPENEICVWKLYYALGVHRNKTALDFPVIFIYRHQSGPGISENQICFLQLFLPWWMWRLLFASFFVCLVCSFVLLSLTFKWHISLTSGDAETGRGLKICSLALSSIPACSYSMRLGPVSAEHWAWIRKGILMLNFPWNCTITSIMWGYIRLCR